jgi:plasmid stabilization system protein ParE
MIHVVYTRRLRHELSQIIETIARDNVPAADAFVARPEHICSLLATTPAMGPLRPVVGRDVRSLVMGNYLVFYRWRRNGNASIFCQSGTAAAEPPSSQIKVSGLLRASDNAER